MTQTEYKKISVSKAVYNRLLEDKQEFSNKIGYNFSFSATINEYHKILRAFRK